MMRRLICFACTVAMALVLLCTPAAAQELNMLDLDSEPTIGTSSAAAVMDEFGNVLFSYNGDVELPMASITKVMTAMVALDSGIPLDQELEFVYEEYPEGSQLAGYQIGDVVTFGELLRVTLIYSANDAATNVAYAVAGSKEAFAVLMDPEATEIGMEHTHFTNPHGLEEEGHHSTALDLLVMGRYAMERELVKAQSAYGEVHVKRSRGFGVTREKAEYEDLARLARENGVSLRDVKNSIGK